MTPLQSAMQHEAVNPSHIVTGDGLAFVCLSCVWTSSGEDKRVLRPGLCRVTTFLGGKEFICIKAVHDDGKKHDQFDSNGRPARWRRHTMVRRYPFGEH